MATTTSSRGRWAPERLLDELERLALHVTDRATFFDDAAERLKRAVHFDGACWHTLDPGSDLITQHRLQGLPDRFSILAENEYGTDDVNKFAELARAPRKAATMSEATGGNLERSPRFRDLLTPAGLGPELRGAFVAGKDNWGALILVRRAGQPEFERTDVELLSAASPLFARAVRRGLVAEACASAQSDASAPGVIELDDMGAPLRFSSTAEPLLAELSGTTAEEGARHPAVVAVASATRQAVGGGGMPAGALPGSATRATSGGWLVLHGGLIGDGTGHVAVFIQRAHPMLVAPLLLRAYGLTDREQEVAQLVLRGATTAGAAQRLSISPHTVNDHLKAVFDKTGARTRGELSAKLFFGEHLPRIQNEVRIGDDASFIDAPKPRGVT
jgi:DNA-binding CsgD family transcriptional regulator